MEMANEFFSVIQAQLAFQSKHGDDGNNGMKDVDMNFDNNQPDQIMGGTTAPQTIASSVYNAGGKSPLDTVQKFNIGIIH